MLAEGEWNKGKRKIVEKRLGELLKAWRPRYRYVITYKDSGKKVIRFDTMWCRRPTPHRPTPDVRVNIEFAFRFSSKDTELTSPKITYRIEHETLVHKELKNVDFHIQRLLKQKLLWFGDNLLPLENAGVLNSRLEYDSTTADKIIGPAPNELTSGVEELGKEDTAVKLELALIDMFNGADADESGALDPEEFQELLLKSDLGFSEGDVKMIMDSYDANDDGLLVYREFIPVAVDVIQAQRAIKHAEELEDKTTDQALEAAEKRLEGFGVALKVAVNGWKEKDPEGTGMLKEEVIRRLLSELPITLNGEEIEMLMLNMDYDSVNEMLAYEDFTNSFEKQIIEVIQELYLENTASLVEVYLRHLFWEEDQKSQDTAGTLPPDVIADVMSKSERINLSSVQVHAIMSQYQSEDFVDYREFSRRTAIIIYSLFTNTNLSAKRLAIQRSTITPIQLLASNTKKRVEAQMRAKFREFDNDDDGYLQPDEFHRCIADTSLCLSEIEIQRLFDSASQGQGQISIAGFMQFAYSTLLTLARDAALKHQFSTGAA